MRRYNTTPEQQAKQAERERKRVVKVKATETALAAVVAGAACVAGAWHVDAVAMLRAVEAGTGAEQIAFVLNGEPRAISAATLRACRSLLRRPELSCTIGPNKLSLRWRAQTGGRGGLDLWLRTAGQDAIWAPRFERA
jgi:hypothetical protein